jgi:acyl carrier protein
MSRQELRERLLSMMRHRIRLQGIDRLEDKMRLNEDLRIDSIMLVQLIVYIEVDLRLAIPDDEVDPRAFDTVGSLLSFMETLESVQSSTTKF